MGCQGPSLCVIFFRTRQSKLEKPSNSSHPKCMSNLTFVDSTQQLLRNNFGKYERFSFQICNVHTRNVLKGSFRPRPNNWALKLLYHLYNRLWWFLLLFVYNGNILWWLILLSVIQLSGGHCIWKQLRYNPFSFCLEEIGWTEHLFVRSICAHINLFRANRFRHS